MKKPIIGITMGDPAGVGPEICLRALASSEVRDQCLPIIFGDTEVLAQCAGVLKLPFPEQVITDNDLSRLGSVTGSGVFHVNALNLTSFEPRVVNDNTGAASYAYINRAIDAALNKQVSAVTTAPINKEALSQAKVKFPGHTEIFAHRAGSERWCMMQYSEIITCTFVTCLLYTSPSPRD